MSARKLKLEIVETFFLVPLRYNDKRKVPIAYFDELEDILIDEFNGWRVEGRIEGKGLRSSIKGAYRMADGSTAYDEVLKYFVAVKPGDIPRLRRVLRKCAADLGQESICFGVTQSQIEFIESDPT